MGVVFYANYVTWFEIGRTEWIRAAGYDYKSIEEKGMLLPVVDLHCRYVAPARYDDSILICTRIGESTPLRVTFQSQIRKVSEGDWQATLATSEIDLPGELLVEGGTKHVWVNREWQPARISKLMPELYAVISGN